MSQIATKPISYRSTTIACYLGNFCQAIVVNFTPILFLTLRNQFGLSFAQLGLLVTINFVSQVTIDLACARLIDKYGFRLFAVLGHIVAAIGLLFFALSPFLFKENVYLGFIIATIIFSIGGGLMEILLSPIVNAIPTKEKATAMSLLHSFYAWGQVTVILLTTLLLFLLPKGWWPLIALFWALLPIFNSILFSRVPLAPAIPEEQRTGMRRIFRQPYFIASLVVIFCGAMTELTISQWASAFIEQALALPKVLGDIAGACMFGVMLGIGRAWYGAVGARVKIYRVMVIGCILGIVCYVTVAVSQVALLSLVACALAGLAASLLWPGSLVLVSHRFPYAGAVLFAVMAAGGDLGASVGPWLVGVVAEHAPKITALGTLVAHFGAEQLGLRAGLLVGTLWPILTLIALLCMKGIPPTQNDTL